MKKLFTFLVLFAACSISIANTTCTGNVSQNNWRWRNNDGNETSATWKVAPKTAITYNASNGVLRLRIEILNYLLKQSDFSNNQCMGTWYALTDSLQYTTDTSNVNSWKNIGRNTANAFVMAGTNTFINQNTPTTQQIPSTPSIFQSGTTMVSDSIIPQSIIYGSTEVEWAIVGTANMLLNTAYYFRSYKYISSTRPRLYNLYPSLTTTAPLPVNFTHFTIRSDGSKAWLNWQTATEQNSDRFEVQRSTDQRTWQTVATVKGKGNSASPVSYSTYDEKPLLSTSYYRLQQFDKDGKSTFSEVRFLKMTGSGATISVWPNPVRETINFSLGDAGAAKLEAILSDVSGKTIYRQTFTSIAPNVVNKLTLSQKPAPGIYLLQLKGDGLLESIKIVVQ